MPPATPVTKHVARRFSLHALRSQRTSSPAAAAALTRPIPAQNLHVTAALIRPYKDGQDRESLKPRKDEYSKSGGDDAAAAADGVFDPSETRPDREIEQAEKGKGKTKQQPDTEGDTDTNPLEVSPANKDLSEPKPAEGRMSGQEKLTRSTIGGVKKKL